MVGWRCASPPGFANLEGLPGLTRARRGLPGRRATCLERCRCYFCHDRHRLPKEYCMRARILFTALIAVMFSPFTVSAQDPPAKAASPPAPKVTFVLKDRHGHAMPARTHTA